MSAIMQKTKQDRTRLQSIAGGPQSCQIIGIKSDACGNLLFDFCRYVFNLDAGELRKTLVVYIKDRELSKHSHCGKILV